MDVCLEAYEVLADRRSFERSERDESAIDLFKSLAESAAAIPKFLITEADALRAASPEIFDKELARQIRLVGPDYAPASAIEFLEKLTRMLQGERPARNAKMTSSRYEIRQTASGWTVWDTAKNTPASVDGCWQTGLEIQTADDLCGSLNWLDSRAPLPYAIIE